MSDESVIVNLDPLTTKSEAEEFVGNKSNYYFEKWDLYSQSPFKGWNWAAWFFMSSWMIYRKMYVEALALLLLFGLSELLFLWHPVRLLLYIILMGILTGACGNALYRKKTLRMMRKAERLEESERLGFLRKKGSTSILAALVLAPLFTLLSWLVALILVLIVFGHQIIR